MRPEAAEQRRKELLAGQSDGNEATRERLERLSWLLDDSVRLPTGHRIGIDGLLGLIPGIGDLVGASISTYFVIVAIRLRVPKIVVGRMGVNILIEAVLGSIPVFGDLFDFAFKANARNYRLLERYLDATRTSTSSAVVVIGTVAAMLLLPILGLLAIAGAAIVFWEALVE